MTAMSASERAANASAELADRPKASECAVLIRIPGSPRTYEIRVTLRGLGLRWDPVGHAWHGFLSPELRVHLARRLGIAPLLVDWFGHALAGFGSGRARGLGPRGPALTR
jgi:hypothetical protein